MVLNRSHYRNTMYFCKEEPNRGFKNQMNDYYASHHMKLELKQ